MTDDPHPKPDDDGPEPDPVEAELIAYLDGELDPPAARRVEARLAADPALRARADALKRSYDLLDFLPKPEPSPTFATRTLDRLPAVKSSPGSKPVAPAAPSSTTPAPQPAVVAAGSSSVPVVVQSGAGSLALSGALAPTSRPGWSWGWAFGLLLAAGAALGAGYVGTSAARTYLFPLPPGAKEPTADQLPLADLRVVQNLPLYAAVDDLDFLDALATPEFFGDEVPPADGPNPPQPTESDKPSGKALDGLLRAFRELPAERQDKIRQLDQQLHEQEPPRRDRLVRVLEAYAAWLYRLQDVDRKRVLAATSPGDRLEAIREARRVQWLANLPAAQRKQLKDLPAADRAALITQWKADEDQRRDAWHTARVHWDAVRTGRPPWPFGDAAMKKEVLAFVKAAYHPDDPARCRLTTSPQGGDLGRMREALDRAEKANEWAVLGQVVHDFSRLPRYEMLPEPATGKPVTGFDDLWPDAAKHFLKRPNARQKLEPHAGKWPDFALAVWDESGKSKQFAVPPSFVLGPSRPDDFKPEVKRLLGDLHKAATPAEWGGLKQLEGKWPEYPRELVRVAKAHDRSVPGAMPPGPPSQWAKTYNRTRPPAPRPGG
jgi:hypothetical protein